MWKKFKSINEKSNEIPLISSWSGSLWVSKLKLIKTDLSLQNNKLYPIMPNEHWCSPTNTSHKAIFVHFLRIFANINIDKWSQNYETCSSGSNSNNFTMQNKSLIYSTQLKLEFMMSQEIVWFWTMSMFNIDVFPHKILTQCINLFWRKKLEHTAW